MYSVSMFGVGNYHNLPKPNPEALYDDVMAVDIKFPAVMHEWYICQRMDDYLQCNPRFVNDVYTQQKLLIDSQNEYDAG